MNAEDRARVEQTATLDRVAELRAEVARLTKGCEGLADVYLVEQKRADEAQAEAETLRARLVEVERERGELDDGENLLNRVRDLCKRNDRLRSLLAEACGIAVKHAGERYTWTTVARIRFAIDDDLTRIASIRKEAGIDAVR